MEKTKPLEKACFKSQRFLKHHSSAILTCLGSIGVVTTSIMAVKATPKALELIKADSRVNHDGDPNAYTTLEAIYSSWQCYIPATLIGVSSIACIFGASVLNKRSQASLASAYAMLNESYQRYRKAANTVYGDDADSKIKAQVADEMFVSADGYYMYYPDLDNSEKTLFYDEYSGRYFTSTLASVINAQYHLNRNLMLRGESSLNELYSFLGIEEINGGDDIGWSMDDLVEGGIMWLDFQNQNLRLKDGTEYYKISALIDPIILYVEGD